MKVVLVAAASLMAAGVVNIAPAQADPLCNPGGPPSGSATRPFDGGTVWASGNGLVGVTTGEGTGTIRVPNASPMPLQAMVVDAQLDGRKQLLVSTGRGVHLYSLLGCRILDVYNGQGQPFVFDLENLRGNGTGVGCEDLGDGRHLVALQAFPDGDGVSVRRTEININGSQETTGMSDAATFGLSDTVPGNASASTISCGDQTMAKDGVQQP